VFLAGDQDTEPAAVSVGRPYQPTHCHRVSLGKGKPLLSREGYGHHGQVRLGIDTEAERGQRSESVTHAQGDLGRGAGDPADDSITKGEPDFHLHADRRNAGDGVVPRLDDVEDGLPALLLTQSGLLAHEVWVFVVVAHGQDDEPARGERGVDDLAAIIVAEQQLFEQPPRVVLARTVRCRQMRAWRSLTQGGTARSSRRCRAAGPPRSPQGPCSLPGEAARVRGRGVRRPRPGAGRRRAGPPGR